MLPCADCPEYERFCEALVGLILLGRDDARGMMIHGKRSQRVLSLEKRNPQVFWSDKHLGAAYPTIGVYAGHTSKSGIVETT